MSLQQEQITTLAALAESLQGASLEDLIRRQVGQSSQSERPPPPTAPDTAPRPEGPTQSQVLDELNRTQRPTQLDNSVFLAQHSKNYIQRDVDTVASCFIPTLLKFYYVLNCMDQVMSDNYYARRSLPYFYPTVTRIYFAVLIHYHLLRLGRHNGTNDQEKNNFLDSLEGQFPVETLAVPGPLLPFFKAMTTSTPENKRLRRVFPTYPVGYLDNMNVQERYVSESIVDWNLPNIPLLIYMHNLLMEEFHGTVHLGADDSAGNGQKTVTYTPVDGYSQIIDLIHHPRSQFRRRYQPFPVTRIADSVDNSVTNVTDAVQTTIYGTVSPGFLNSAPVLLRNSMTKCGIAEPILVHKDLTSQFKTNYSRIPIPDAGLDDVNDTWQAFFYFEEGTEWFSHIASSMAGYAKFFPNSGTLGDCSLEGPRIGQYINTVVAPETMIVSPDYHGDSSIIHQFTAKQSTTVSEEEEVVELTSRYTQIFTRMFKTHPWLDILGSDYQRSGPFWSVRPLYENSTTDSAWKNTPQTIKSVVLERPERV